jgi:hypothetical protein
VSKPDLWLERRVDGRLWAALNGERRPVSVRRLFPWSGAGDHVSLRDGENREFAFVAQSAGLGAASRAVLDEALQMASFVLEVTKVLEVEEEIEIRVWRVETRQGPRVFQTRLDDWPRELPGGGILIRDVAGDLYHVPDPDALDRGSQETLWAFVD